MVAVFHLAYAVLLCMVKRHTLMIDLTGRSEWSYLNGYCLRSGEEFATETEEVEYCSCRQGATPTCSADIYAAPCGAPATALTDGIAVSLSCCSHCWSVLLYLGVALSGYACSSMTHIMQNVCWGMIGLGKVQTQVRPSLSRACVEECWADRHLATLLANKACVEER